MKTVLGIDLGTQSLKVAAYDFEAQTISASAAAPLDVDRDDAGKAEQTTSAWLGALETALAQLSDEIRASICAIGVSGQQHGFVALDALHNALVPVKLWCDTSTQTEVEEITLACGGRNACIEISGNPVLTGYTAPKIRWMKNRYPELYEKLTHILLPHDYLNFVLTGEMAMEYGDASGTGLLDVRERRWSTAMLRAVDSERDLSECLPPLSQADEAVGYTTQACATRFGLPQGIPVASGGGDNMMAAIGTGNVVAGRLTMSLGTSGTLFAYADAPVVDAAGNIAAFCSSTGGWLPLLCTMNCTSATELMRRTLNVTIAAFDEVIDSVDAGCDGLTVLPFFAGERTPDLPNAKAEFLGLSNGNCSGAHLLRATVEGVTFGLRFGLEELRRLGVESTEIVLTGGGARSLVWRQIIADTCHLPVTTLENDEGACFGAALQGLWVLERNKRQSCGIEELTAQHVRVTSQTLPTTGSRKRYDSAYLRYTEAVSRAAESQRSAAEQTA